MRIMLTGGTGKIGNAVASMLLARGDEVIALVREPERARKLLPEGAQLAPGDVVVPDSLERACAGADAVVNCMGLFEQWLPDIGAFNRVNAEGARNVAAATRRSGARRLVHTSTFDVFDAGPGGTVDEEHLAGLEKPTPYERSKQLAERLVLAEASREGELEVVIVNPAGICGPGPWAEAGFDGLLRDTLRGRLPAVPPGGMSLTWVPDAAAAHVVALDRGEPGRRYIVGGGYATIQEICATAVTETGRGRTPGVIPLALARPLARIGERVAAATGKPPLLPQGQLRFLQWGARLDATRLRTELGVDPLGWEPTVRRTARWLLETGRI